ncbi:MAG: 5-methyltetrahydropteroyltriglutamate--homocysteine S-methyltransferase [Prevotella sp.]|jgi:methionine synthase II (cobalamin-independent)|uniref:5-methyltetrahydropteroyltriglutamate--homocysteine S-methyltransferase n=1 Tax=Segatella cerevisiae TaxID=2053716 RepID=A0ABT1BXE7_9BACT|nr:5-methyltetrahydropteroyltriglutamate--homocysteine S-methyltransferase [Segatella cerevisiae]MCH3995259.1 5-methyltetrahydropteroyltriglutamate--homocysteine S-methyltransferase [Prevotella sp.]MCI1246563.1 5-methyltetrahydropteroyltriglutamate--homocysteine S-methyltransferase [Prevotella sp.]MCO6025721.1 5-methyltetrahydropteroyltriglutamate--homocysteine S-methyltransferase [Segatella cerevisiae]
MKKDFENAPFRADVVGSFLRPEKLKNARKAFSEGKIDASGLKAVEDECIRDLVKKEKEHGMKGVTDGEFRRSWWHLDFMWGLNGIEKEEMKEGYHFHGENTRNDSAHLVDKVSFNPQHPFFEHFKFLRDIAGEDVVPRQTIPAPAQTYAELTRGENTEDIKRIYGGDNHALLTDLATAYHKTILAFYELGCRNIQLDDCTWGMLVDRRFWTNQGGDDYDVRELADTYLEVNNMAIENLPEDLVINTHVCRGNYHSTWAASGGYEPIANILFSHEKVHAFYLEYDSDRAGGFEPLRFVPKDKLVVLGLITSKSPKLENREEILGRIDDASNYIPKDRLCLSPQCGFSSTEEGNKLTEDEQWKKVDLVQSIAKEVWG